jgi:hypothetical protein
VLAAAVLVVAGWVAALPVVGVSAAGATAYWLVGGTDTDIGALFGSRVDERHVVVRTRARLLATAVVLALATIGAVAAPIAGRPVWPFASLVAVGAGVFALALVWVRRTGRIASLGDVRPGGRLVERAVNDSGGIG